MMNWLQRQWLRFRVSRMRIDEHALCPGCGYRYGKIRLSVEDRNIRHECAVCFAVWAEPTLLDADEWLALK